ncbi:MAG: hypothetical protein AB1696_21450 [Planctomycetota bacterium]
MSDEPRRPTFWTDLLHIGVATAVGNVTIAFGCYILAMYADPVSLIENWLSFLPYDVRGWIAWYVWAAIVILMFECYAFVPFVVIWRFSKTAMSVIRKQARAVFWGAFTSGALTVVMFIPLILLYAATNLSNASLMLYVLGGISIVSCAGFRVGISFLGQTGQSPMRVKGNRAFRTAVPVFIAAPVWALLLSQSYDSTKFQVDRYLGCSWLFLADIISTCVFFPLGLSIGAKILTRPDQAKGD